jgi:hypothetical protein
MGRRRKKQDGVFPFLEGGVMQPTVKSTRRFMDFFPVLVCLSIRIGRSGI